MWAQDWQNIYDLVVPFPNENDIQVTANLKKKNLTSIDLFKVNIIFSKSNFTY
jgi:peptidyl-dipeptidase A